jgi:hypothetical protein
MLRPVLVLIAMCALSCGQNAADKPIAEPVIPPPPSDDAAVDVALVADATVADTQVSLPPKLTPAAPAKGRPIDTKLEVLATAIVYRSSENQRSPWKTVEITNVFGFKKKPTKGKPVTVLPAEVAAPPLELRITALKERKEDRPYWWEVELEPVVAQEYFVLAPPAGTSGQFLGRVAVLYPAIPGAVLVDPSGVDAADIPKGVARKTIVLAVDSTGDRRPDGIEASFCCDDETKSAETDPCDYTCSRTFLRRRGKWLQVDYSQPQ